jgi:hypothetical protein
LRCLEVSTTSLRLHPRLPRLRWSREHHTRMFIRVRSRGGFQVRCQRGRWVETITVTGEMQRLIPPSVHCRWAQEVSSGDGSVHRLSATHPGIGPPTSCAGDAFPLLSVLGFADGHTRDAGHSFCIRRVARPSPRGVARAGLCTGCAYRGTPSLPQVTSCKPACSLGAATLT